MENILLGTIGTPIIYRNKTYTISNDEIHDGDLIWNEPSKSIDKCVAIIGDDIVVQFSTGFRSTLKKQIYQKLL